MSGLRGVAKKAWPAGQHKSEAPQGGPRGASVSLVASEPAVLIGRLLDEEGEGNRE
jgi:hypothetical protein